MHTTKIHHLMKGKSKQYLKHFTHFKKETLLVVLLAVLPYKSLY